MILASEIARVCHEANRAYCLALGDGTQKPWDEAPDWQRESAIKGVEFLLANPLANPIDSHVSWQRQKEADGWVYGATKDEAKKTHPCMVPYHELPEAQRRKDHLFAAIVRALTKKMEA